MRIGAAVLPTRRATKAWIESSDVADTAAKLRLPAISPRRRGRGIRPIMIVRRKRSMPRVRAICGSSRSAAGQTVRARASSTGRRIHRRLCTEAHARASRAQHIDQAAAGRRIPDRERAGCCRARLRQRSERSDAVFASLEHIEGAKGRLERVGERNGRPIFVDYAHKPDAPRKCRRCGHMPNASSS